MKYGYFLAYTDIRDDNYKEIRSPWIYPTKPLRKKDLCRENLYLKLKVLAQHVTPFRVELNDIPEYITWHIHTILRNLNHT
jgi:hypothetical protein